MQSHTVTFLHRLFVIVLILCYGQNSFAQDETPKYEIGAQFSSLSFNDNDGRPTGAVLREFGDQTLPGIGGRFTYNLNDHVGLEAEANFFFGDTELFAPLGSGGRPFQAVFGIKAGKRFEKFGVFAKARPGLVSLSEGKFDLSTLGDPSLPISFFDVQERATHFAVDVGGVVEFYPSRRIVTRFDIGDTIIRYGDQTLPVSGAFLSGTIPPTRTVSSETRHNFQFSAGVGFRF